MYTHGLPSPAISDTVIVTFAPSGPQSPHQEHQRRGLKKHGCLQGPVGWIIFSSVNHSAPQPCFLCETSITTKATQSRKSRSAILFYTGVNTTITKDDFPLAFPQSVVRREHCPQHICIMQLGHSAATPPSTEQHPPPQLQGKLPLQTLLSTLVLYPRL